MSADHKRPLFAFTVVALLCALFVGNALRSEAVVSVLRAVEATTAAVAPELLGDRAPAQPERASAQEAAPRGDRAAAPRAERRSRTAPVVERSGRDDRARSSATERRAKGRPAVDGTTTGLVDATIPQDVTPVGTTPAVRPSAAPRPLSPRALPPRAVAPRGLTPRVVTPRVVTPRVVTPRVVTPRTAPQRPSWAGQRGRNDRATPTATTPSGRWVVPGRGRGVQQTVAPRPRLAVPQRNERTVNQRTVNQRTVTLRTPSNVTTRQAVTSRGLGKKVAFPSRSQRGGATGGLAQGRGHSGRR